MEKLICNAPWGKAKTSRFARVVALVRKVATSATLPAVLALAVTALGDGLPNGYTQVPYIQANGNCQIQTGIVPNSTDKVELSWRPTVVSGNQGLWCSRDSSAKNTFTAFMIANKVRLDRNGSSVTCAGALLACTNYTVVADYATLVGVVTNDISHTELTRGTMPSGDYTPTSELCLFASHQGAPTTSFANAGSWACYSFKLSDSAGNLRLNLVPARRDADGELGLYDLVRSTFLTNCNSGVFTTANMTITPSDPLWGKALTIADDITIDAGEGATWQGAITVRDGGSLTTRGNLNVAGTTTIDANGSVTVANGTSLFTFAANTIKGNLTVAASATLKMNITEAFQGATTTVFHLYGTLDAQAYRQRIDGGKFFFHDGSRVIGAGDAYCALYAYRDSRVVFDGTVEIEPPVAMVNAYTLTAACCENARVAFKGGFKAYTASQKTGLFVQEAATAEEGNASGTCANALVEVGPCAYGGAYYYTGSMNFVSPAKIALANTNGFTVATSAAQLELVADKATGLSNHAAVLPLPEIVADATSASLPTVRLTGDGTVSLPTATPAYPIEFAGPSLAIANGAPIALAAGSSVTAPMTVGVNDLPAGTAATLFTNAGSIDASKISARAAHNGVLMGTAAAATLSGTDVVTAGVAAYDATAWIEPYIAAKALIWLDASDAANFEFKDNTFGFVTTWKDKSAYKRDATAYTIASHDPNWGTLTVTNGVPAYCMGACDSGIDLAFSVRMTTIRTVFWAMSICQDSRAFFLGDSSTYRFHRGGNGQYCYNNSSALWKNGKIYCDGVLVTDNLNTLVPTDRHVYSTVTAANCESNRLTLDRNSGSYSRHGGRELSELIAFDVPLSDADREAIEAYLAAKWMGSNPTAARSDDTFIYKSDYTVDGNVGGGKNLDFEEGASVTVVNPSASEPMIATTGAVTLPSGSPLAVNVDATALVPGTYTVMQAGSGITSLSQFAPTATVGAGASATFAVVDGKLTMTIAVSSSVTSQTWRPVSSADLGWNQASANWLYDGGTTGGFIPYVPAFIDGAESASGDITVSGSMFAGPITLTGANDYTFKGDGTLAGGDTVTLGGTGTVTLDGASFGDQTIVITNGQKVVLGPNASQNALGTDSGSSGGKVEIGGGGQLNINYTGVVSGTADPRAEITHHKTFAIAGDGPDGRGALINDALDGRGDLNPYGSQFRRIELTDDATVGGTHRMEVRAHTATAGTATPGIYGPGKRLTVKSTNPYGFGVVSQPVKVEAVTIVEGARLRPETIAESQFDIPGGITLDGGTMDLYSSTFSTNVPFYITANGGKFIAGSGATTIKGNVNVASGASLALTGDQNVTYSGAFNANGAAVTHSSSAATYFTGTSEGNLDITQTAGTVQLQNKVEGTMAVTKSGGDLYLRTGFSNDTVNVTQTGGNFRFYTEATAPIFDTLNLDGCTAGTIYIQPQSTSALVDVPGTIALGESARNVYVYGPANNKGIKIKVTGKSAQFGPVCDTTNPGTVYLKSGTALNATDFACGNVVSKPARGHMIIEEGAKVTVRNRFMNAYWSGVPAAPATHRIDIYGEVDATGYTAYLTLDGVRGETYLHDGGVFKFKTLTVTRLTTLYPYGTGVGAGDGRQWFIMDGGHLELAALSASALPGCTKIDFQNGTVVNTASYGTSQGVPLFFGYESVGGEVEFNLPSGGYVNLNTGLSGASAVTVKGNGYIGGTRTGAVWQGALLGKIALETTGTTTNDLCNASVFAGGLALADGASAKVGKYADALYPFAVSIASKVSNRDKLVTNDWSYAYGAADAWGYLHKRYTTGKPYGNYPSQGMRCEFYVPAEKAGTWTFCGAYDDYMFVQIDDTAVFNQAYNALAAHQVTLSAGWHKLAVATYDGTGNCGAPASNGWNDGKTLGFIIGESTSTAGGDYTKFEPGASLGDGLTLQVRPCVNACVWSWQNGNGSWSTTENWSHIKCLDSVNLMHKSDNSSDGSSWASYFQNKASKFEGWFKVEDDKAGVWTFKMAYNQNSQLKIDGERVLYSTDYKEVPSTNMTLTAGWHRWEVRLSDTGGAWGPRGYNSGMTVSYSLPGETANLRFNETNLKLAATLGDIAVLEPSGIYKELELGAGSTLTSSGTMAMPIFGTLKGTGTLAGSFAFAGTANCWEVTGAGARTAELPAATFANATAATFAGLKSVKVTFDAKPTRKAYYLTGVIDGLSAADLPAATMKVKDADDRDYSANFTLMVKNGRLAIGNSKPAGITIIVR